MKKLVFFSLAALSIGVLTQPASADVAGEHGWSPFFIDVPVRGVDPRALARPNAGSVTLPSFTNTVKSPLDGRTYRFSILGTDPTKTAASTTISYVPIALRVHFPGGVVLDPTKPGCSDTVSVNNRFFASPLFVNTTQISNGINVGSTQVIDAFQRAEFWQFVANKNYHVLLSASRTTVILVDVTAPSGSSSVAGACTGSGHNLGLIDVNAYDAILQQITNKFATTAQLPVILAYNVVLTSGPQCCIIGYHSAFGRSTGTQVYATGAYTDAGIFSAGLQDIHAWSHEIGELFNDPFVNNSTPTWGHIGQVSGCQGNFETGDPLTGTPYLDTLNGFTYHPQEQAFFSWFYRTPSLGTEAKFSFEGTFKTAQGACH